MLRAEFFPFHQEEHVVSTLPVTANGLHHKVLDAISEEAPRVLQAHEKLGVGRSRQSSESRAHVSEKP